MPVQSPCPEYLENSPEWKLVRDCVKGEAAIKSGGAAYLPKPSGQSAEDYARYAARVHWFDAAGRTADGLHGNIFSRPPVQDGETPPAFEALLENIDKAGTGIGQFASDLCWDAMQTGWGGILADHSAVPEGTKVPQAEEYGLTSYLKWYPAENIINWRYDTANGRKKLSLVVLKENYAADSGDEFIPRMQERFRVLKLAGGVYVQQVYEKQADKDEFAVTEEAVPKMNGQPLPEIPFFPCPGPAPEKSMLLGLAYENIGHYQKTADYENSIHYSGTPTPYVSGMEAPKDINGNLIDVPLGSSKIMFFPGDGDKTPAVSYLETSGAGTGQILAALQACEERMAILGARIISVEKKGVETAEAARIHRAGENAVLGAFARNMSGRITEAVRLAAIWRGVPAGIAGGWAYALNVDYEGDLSQEDEKKLAIQEIDAGVLSKERYLTEYGGMTGEQAQEELEKIRNNGKPEHDFTADYFGNA